MSTTLDTLLGSPALAAAVPLADLPALLDALAQQAVRLDVLKSVLAVRLAVSKAESKGADDRLIDVDQAAERLGVTRDWLRRRPELPFVVKLSEGVVRYSSRGIEQWIAARLRRGTC